MILLNIMHSFITHHRLKPWCILEWWGCKCLAGWIEWNSLMLSACITSLMQRSLASQNAFSCIAAPQLVQTFVCWWRVCPKHGKTLLYTCLRFSPCTAVDLTFIFWFYIPFSYGFSQQPFSIGCCDPHHWRSPPGGLIEGAVHEIL